jgi:hydroxymethylpyrimidine pyrophosphatase-like HAD family hydrolase
MMKTAMTGMQALSDWPLEHRRRVIGVFTDIDDTLTTNGAITQDALQALTALKAAGLHVVAITGRPIGWCEPFAQGDAQHGIAPWPLDAMVAENGAVAFAMGQTGPQGPMGGPCPLSKLYLQDEATRRSNYHRLQAVAQQVLQAIPGTALAQDSAGRETDIAIDHSEFAHLSAEQIDAVVALMRAAGLNASISSIHINGWLGAHNKLVGAHWIVAQRFGRSLAAEISRWAYVGDSTNDQTMFEAFDNSVGVANIRRFAADLVHAPRYIAQHERGAGFAEVARAVLAAL